MNGGDIIKVTKSVMLLEKSYPPGDHILRVFCLKIKLEREIAKKIVMIL